jgi:hypothetical protein
LEHKSFEKSPPEASLISSTSPELFDMPNGACSLKVDRAPSSLRLGRLGKWVVARYGVASRISVILLAFVVKSTSELEALSFRLVKATHN